MLRHGKLLLAQRSQQDSDHICTFTLEELIEPLLLRVLPSLALAETAARASHAQRITIACLSAFSGSADLQGQC